MKMLLKCTPINILTTQVVHEVFRRLLCQEGGVAFDSLGPKGFLCLWRYFSVVNAQAEALSGSFVQKVQSGSHPESTWAMPWLPNAAVRILACYLLVFTHVCFFLFSAYCCIAPCRTVQRLTSEELDPQRPTVHFHEPNYMIDRWLLSCWSAALEDFNIFMHTWLPRDAHVGYRGFSLQRPQSVCLS